MKDNEKAIFLAALEKWGKEAQIDMLVEEAAEVIQAVSKFKRHGGMDALSNNPKSITNYQNIHEEIADLSIMIDQMRLIFDTNLIDKIRKDKVSRLNDRIIGLF